MVTKTTKNPAGQARKPGAVAKAITGLLLGKTVHSYGKIAERVRARVPGSHPTARSVASVASALRAGGHDIPDRRRQAA